jgi:hypothetical protein
VAPADKPCGGRRSAARLALELLPGREDALVGGGLRALLAERGVRLDAALLELGLALLALQALRRLVQPLPRR